MMNDSHLRLEPVMEPNDMRMFHSLKHFQFVINHLLVILDILLHDNLDGIFATFLLSFPNDSIRSST